MAGPGLFSLDIAPALRFASAMPRRSRALAALSLLALALGCASTTLEKPWIDTSFRGGPFRKLLIVGLGVAPEGRSGFENAVADALAERGLLGIGSTGYFERAEEMNREAVRAWVERDGYQGVLVTRLVNVERERSEMPATYTDLWGYWGYYGGYVTPGYVVESTTVYLSTDLFDAASARVVYSVRSKSFQPGSRQEVIRELTALLVGDLTRQGLLPSAAP